MREPSAEEIKAARERLAEWNEKEAIKEELRKQARYQIIRQKANEEFALEQRALEFKHQEQLKKRILAENPHATHDHSYSPGVVDIFVAVVLVILIFGFLTLLDAFLNPRSPKKLKKEYNPSFADNFVTSFTTDDAKILENFIYRGVPEFFEDLPQSTQDFFIQNPNHRFDNGVTAMQAVLGYWLFVSKNDIGMGKWMKKALSKTLIHSRDHNLFNLDDYVNAWKLPFDQTPMAKWKKKSEHFHKWGILNQNSSRGYERVTINGVTYYGDASSRVWKVYVQRDLIGHQLDKLSRFIRGSKQIHGETIFDNFGIKPIQIPQYGVDSIIKIDTDRLHFN